MGVVTSEAQGHVRGPDGFITPYSDAEVRRLISENVQHVIGLVPVMESLLPGKMKLTYYLLDDEPGSMGPRLYWIYSRSDGASVAAGIFERDVDWEQEKRQREGVEQVYWIAQGACVLPENQRQSIYTQVLRETHRLTGRPLTPDTQQTRASAGLWEKLIGEIGEG